MHKELVNLELKVDGGAIGVQVKGELVGKGLGKAVPLLDPSRVGLVDGLDLDGRVHNLKIMQGLGVATALFYNVALRRERGG